MQNHKKVIQKRKERERNQRIHSILIAAKKVFFLNGYFKATMDEIALEAEISKPTVYSYFKSKEDLFFQLMVPIIDDMFSELQKLEKRLMEGKCKTGSDFVNNLFKVFNHNFKLDPDMFRIILIFQQGGLIGQFNAETRDTLNDKARLNFELGRKMITLGIEQGLLKEIDIHDFLDILWGLFIGLVQLDGIKTQYFPDKTHFQKTLDLSKKILIHAVTTNF